MNRHDSAAARLLKTLSLDALRGFEAAARLGSFTAAAEALSLTQSAVSKQVRQLEDALGQALFVRAARGLSLTAEGRVLHAGTQAALRQLETTLSRLVPGQRRRVAVSVTPSFASLWLVPRLPAFHALAPDVDVQVDASEDSRVLERDGFDLAIRLSPPEQAEAAWRLLIPEQLVLVAAPAVAGRVRTPADLAQVPLLVFNHPIERHAGMGWRHWMDRFGLVASPTQPVFQFTQYEHVLRAATQGLGVAIGRLPLVQRALDEGSLQEVLADKVSVGLNTYLLLAPQAAGREEVRAFADWIAAALCEPKARETARTLAHRSNVPTG